MIVPLAWFTGAITDYLQVLARTNRSTIFWTVLAILLGIGCIVYLFRWLYERNIRAHNRQLRAVYELTESLVTTSDFEAVQQKITEIIPDLADATHCFLLLLNPARQQLEYIAGSEKPPASGISLSAISGAVTCYRNQALTDVRDAENCPFVDKDAVRRWGQKSLLYVPLISEGQCFGVLEIEDRRSKRLFTPDQIARVEHIAKLTALAWSLRSQSSLKEQLYRAEKAALVRSFIEGVVEQLAAPLEKIPTLLPASGVAVNSAQVSHAAEIERQTKRVLEVLKEIVRFVHPKEGDQASADANAALEDVAGSLQPLLDEHNLTAELQLSRNPLPISVDPEVLESLFSNVLRNAVRMLAGARGTSLRISSSRMSHCALISVTPAGTAPTVPKLPPGASQDELDVLRLSVCKGLVESLGGILRVDRDAPPGFQLEIELPLAVGEWTDHISPAPKADTAAAGHPSTVLIVDDNAEIQKALVQQIAERGYRVLPVGSAEEGLDLCDRTRFDWVLCSSQIGRMSGLEIYQSVRHKVGNFVLLADEDSPLASPEPPAAEGPLILRIPFTPRDIDELLEAEMAEVETGG